MTPAGHQNIIEALQVANVLAEVTPAPQESQDLEFVTIRTNQDPTVADVMNALGEAGLLALEIDDGRMPVQPDSTQLRFVDSEVRTVAGSGHRKLSAAARFITLQDMVTSSDRPVYSVR